MKRKESRLGHIVKEGILDIFYIWKEELREVFKDQGVMIFFFLVPLVYPVLYAFIYDNEVVRDARLVAVDLCDSHTSREFIRRVDATPDVQVIAVCSTMEEARQMMDRKEAYGILYFPADFSRTIHLGGQGHVSLYTDMSSMLYYKAFLLSATEVSLEMGKEQIGVDPVPAEYVAMYNTQNGFAGFLVPPILMLIIQQTLILGICMLGGTSREKNRFHSLLPDTEHYKGTLRVIFGKSLVYVLLYTLVCLWTLAIVPRLFSLPQTGDPWTVFLFLLPYLFACIFLAITLSGFMTTRESPMMIFVFTSILFLFISGISWPKESIPVFWKTLGYFVPSTPGIQGFVRINTTGATLNEVANEYHLLWIHAGFYFITACLVYRYQLIRSRKLLRT
ncbi:MAG: ABC transporter permease [Tannerellaceae bacterium]|jgi:ABC-2 type transport system permease protein|nr:ABC transporter permease [Tannerellaceae bacterium]